MSLYIPTMINMSLYISTINVFTYFDDEMFRTINVLIIKYFKDKLSISTSVNVNISTLVNVNISTLVNVNISTLVNVNISTLVNVNISTLVNVNFVLTQNQYLVKVFFSNQFILSVVDIKNKGTMRSEFQ
jgi:hypothetical protein